jgi:hypothetical protein
MLSFIMLTCHNADCYYAECRYAECHYAECHGTKFPQQMKFQLVSIFFQKQTGSNFLVS